MKIAIFAAGTGGHIYPALSIAEKFGKENVIFIASNRAVERKIYKNSGFQVSHLNISGFRGKIKNVSDMSSRVKMDRYYFKNWSLFLDFKIRNYHLV